MRLQSPVSMSIHMHFCTPFYRSMHVLIHVLKSVHACLCAYMYLCTCWNAWPCVCARARVYCTAYPPKNPPTHPPITHHHASYAHTHLCTCVNTFLLMCAYTCLYTYLCRCICTYLCSALSATRSRRTTVMVSTEWTKRVAYCRRPGGVK